MHGSPCLTTSINMRCVACCFALSWFRPLNGRGFCCARCHAAGRYGSCRAGVWERHAHASSVSWSTLCLYWQQVHHASIDDQTVVTCLVCYTSAFCALQCLLCTQPVSLLSYCPDCKLDPQLIPSPYPPSAAVALMLPLTLESSSRPAALFAYQPPPLRSPLVAPASARPAAGVRRPAAPGSAARPPAGGSAQRTPARQQLFRVWGVRP